MAVSKEYSTTKQTLTIKKRTMKKFILFALLLSVTAIGNNTFAAKMSQNRISNTNVTIEKSFKIKLKEGKTVDQIIEAVKQSYTNVEKDEIKCYAIVSIKSITYDVETDTIEITISVLIDCFEVKPIGGNNC
jgi:uncharacterized membrane protein